MQKLDIACIITYGASVKCETEAYDKNIEIQNFDLYRKTTYLGTLKLLLDHLQSFIKFAHVRLSCEKKYFFVQKCQWFLECSNLGRMFQVR